MSFLNANRRRRVREIAREEYLVARALHPNPKRQPEGIGALATNTAITRITNAPEYQSILGKLLAAVAVKLAIALIEKLRRQNKRPFAYIEEDNQRAISLVTKLGFKRDKKVHWFQMR